MPKAKMPFIREKNTIETTLVFKSTTTDDVVVCAKFDIILA